ncbi:rCG34416 [Rattus norvegicus]|uniref:RCG34416 n=1 Tax=Rattus norvegicus TaxID=10116 RepID=A6HD99_RAT|nr:rCG34416 [Rattus norvegicus]
MPEIPEAWEAEAGSCLRDQGQRPGCQATLWKCGHSHGFRRMYQNPQLGPSSRL